MPRYELSGRVVVVTGSSGGLGRALCPALRARGARLALFDLDARAVQSQAGELGGERFARGWAVDVRSLAGLEAAMAEAAAHFGQIDVVIANAGIEALQSLADIDPGLHERVIDVNLNGVWRTFRAGLPYVAQQEGYLLAIASMAAFVHSPLQSSYVAAKAGVWALCDSLRLEVRDLGVSVGSVHPTFFKTPMTDAMVADPAGEALWGGHAPGLLKMGIWRMVPLDSVVAAIVRGIERRRQFIVVPRLHYFVAWAPSHFRWFVEWWGFRGGRITKAMAAARGKSSPAGKG